LPPGGGVFLRGGGGGGGGTGVSNDWCIMALNQCPKCFCPPLSVGSQLGRYRWDCTFTGEPRRPESARNAPRNTVNVIFANEDSYCPSHYITNIYIDNKPWCKYGQKNERTLGELK